jgi:hypothetical protein
MSLVIVSTTPNDGQYDLAVDTALYVTFNKELVSTALNDSLFNLVRADTLDPISCTVEYNIDEGEYQYQVVKVTPRAALHKNTAYKLYINVGIEATDEDKLLSKFTLDFKTGGAVTATPDAPDAPEDVYTGQELRILRSTPAADSHNAVGNSVIIVCNQGIPSVTQFLITARDPLGTPLAAVDAWAAAAVPTISGRIVTLAPADDSILLSSNRIYSIEMVHPDNALLPALEFMTVLDPYYVSIERVRLEYGGAAQDLSDFELLLHVYEKSMEAQGLWKSGTEDIPSTTPYAVREYVKFRVVQQLLRDVIRNSRSTGRKAVALGDLRVTMRDIDPNALNDLDGIVGELHRRVVAGDTSAVPIDPVPGYALVRNGNGTIGTSTTDLDGTLLGRRIAHHTETSPRGVVNPFSAEYSE